MRSPRAASCSHDHARVPSSAGPSSSLVSSKAIGAGVVRRARRRIPRSRPPSPRSRSSCRRRRGRTAGRRGASARRGRWSTARAGRWAPRRCGRRRPASAAGAARRGACAHRLVTRKSSGPLRWSRSRSRAAPGARRAALAARVVGRDRAAGDQRFGQVQRASCESSRPHRLERLRARFLGRHVERDVGEGGVRRPALERQRSATSRLRGAMSFCRRHIRLVGESACARPSSRETTPSVIRRAMSCLEGLRAFGQRLLHRLLDAGEVALLDQLGHQRGVQQHLDRRARARRRASAAGAARRSRAGRPPGRTAARGAPRAGRTTGCGRARGSCCWRAAWPAPGGPTAHRRSPRSWSRGRGSRRSGCSRAPGAARSSARSAATAVSRPTSRWLTIDFLLVNRNSIGSSMVRMWPVHLLVAVLEHRRQRGALAGAGGADHQDQAALLHHQRRSGSAAGPASRATGCRGGMQRTTAAIVPRWRKALTAGSCRRPASADAEVQLAGVVELLELRRRQHLGQQLARLRRRQRLVGQLQDLAVDPDQDRRVGRQVDVRGALSAISRSTRPCCRCIASCRCGLSCARGRAALRRAAVR